MRELTSDHALLVFGGPYSNLHATRAMRAEAERLAIPASHTICTGDVVAYCADPEETTQLIRDCGIQVVAGNCEEQLAASANDCGCGFEEGSACDLLSKGWYPHANGQLSKESRAWMADLPRHLTLRYAGHRFRVIHGGVARINRFLFASQRELLAEELDAADCDVVVAGHSGLPFVAPLPAGLWFNPGVIGMPANDGTPDGWYGLVQAESGELRLSVRRLPYDHESAAAALWKSGHADGYAGALESGIWPSLDVLPPSERAATGLKLDETILRWRRPTAPLREAS